MCSVTGPNWANGNVTQRTKLLCWESSLKMDYLYSHFSQVSVFYWYTSVVWDSCYLEVQIVKNVGVTGVFMSDLQDVVGLLFLHFTDSIAGKGRAFLYVFYFWSSPSPRSLYWSCKWCLNYGIWELNLKPCFSFVPPILSRCFQELMSLLSYLWQK